MRKTNAAKTERNAPPASQTRPKLATTRPEPADETTPDTYAELDMARIADLYDAIRIKQEEFEREEERLRVQLIDAMKSAKRKNVGTLHGRITLLEATEDKPVPDLDAAVALLEKHAIPQPPTMEAWLAQHRLAMPTKTKKGLSDRIKFEQNK